MLFGCEFTLNFVVLISVKVRIVTFLCLEASQISLFIVLWVSGSSNSPSSLSVLTPLSEGSPQNIFEEDRDEVAGQIQAQLFL